MRTGNRNSAAKNRFRKQPAATASDRDRTGGSRAQAIQLLNRVVGKLYDGNEALWDEVLALLNIGLQDQAQVAAVLSEGRWRQAANPLAYVATAAVNQALKHNLVNRHGHEETFGRQYGEKLIAEIQIPDEDGNDLSHDDTIDTLEYAAEETFPHDPDDYYIESTVAEELLLSDGTVDWCKVAKRAVVKGEMVESVATILKYRAQRIPRATILNLAQNREERKQLQAAEKWINRNKLRIQAVIQGQPLSKAKRKVAGGFMPPGEALKRAIQREQHW